MSRSRIIAGASLAFWLAAATGCSLLLDVDKPQCRVDAECSQLALGDRCVAGACQRDASCDGGACESAVSRDAGLAACRPNMPCPRPAEQTCWLQQCVPNKDLGSFLCDVPPAPAGSTLTISVHVQELISSQPPPGLQVRACDVFDTPCTKPEGMFVDRDGRGDVTLEVPWEFRGYLELTSDATLPLMFHFFRPLTASVELSPIYMMSEAIVNAQAQLAGVPPVGNSSLVVLEMRDCDGNALPGVRFESSFKDSVPFVIVDGAPTGDRTLTVRDESTNSAFALLPNIPPGFVFFDAYLGDEGPLLDQANVPIQPGSVTEVEFRPPYPMP